MTSHCFYVHQASTIFEKNLLQHTINAIFLIVIFRLYEEFLGANIVLQVFSDTEIMSEDMEILMKIDEAPFTFVIISKPGNESENEHHLCDCSLRHSIARLQTHTLPQIQKYLTEDSIIVLTHTAVFLATGSIFNVLKTGHETWLYGHEGVAYNLGFPWPTVFTAMTVRRWKLITNNTNSCTNLVSQNPKLWSEFYVPPWKEAMNRNETNSTSALRTNIRIIDGWVAAEKFTTHRLLQTTICYIPGYLKTWSSVKAEKYFDMTVDDVYTCWKGIGYNACTNDRGYWYYPGVLGCNYWVDTYPWEIFDQVIGQNDPIRKLVMEETNIVFKSF